MQQQEILTSRAVTPNSSMAHLFHGEMARKIIHAGVEYDRTYGLVLT